MNPPLNPSLYVVLLDDNPDDRRLVRREMEREFPGIHLSEVIDQADFDRVLAADSFHAVVTDYQLKWTNGLRVLQTVKERFPDCPVVMFTNTGTEEVAVEAMKSGLDDYLLKKPAVYPRVPLAVQAAIERSELRVRARQHEAELAVLNARLRRAMRETHHRVKNNLQMIAALADLQTEDDLPVPASAMRRIAQHANALATIHDLLTHEAFQRFDLEDVSACRVLDRLVPLLQTATGKAIDYTCEDFFVSMRECNSLTLLITELVANAVKHGGGEIEVTLRRDQDRAVLQVSDGGPGFPQPFDPSRDTNTGINLIVTLARHDLQGQISFGSREEGGAQVSVIFPLTTPSRATTPAPDSLSP